MKPAFALLVAFLLLIAPLSTAASCSSDSDCDYGYVCTQSACVDGGASACKAYCKDGIAYQTAYSSSSGCTIAGTYTCTYGCAATGPDCATSAATSTSTKTRYCTADDSFSSIYECTIKYPDNADATTIACIDDCRRSKSVPTVVAQAGGMVDVIIEDEFRACVQDYCLGGTTPVTDKCSGVTCGDKCESGTLYSDGTCDSNTGQCDYTETSCPQGCADDGKSCKAEMKGRIYYTDELGTEVPIKYAKVETYAVKDTRILAYGHLTTDKNGEFTWSDSSALSPGNTISGTVYLEDQKGGLYVSDPNSVSTPIGIAFMDNVPAASALDYEFDFATFKNKQLAGDAKIYALAQKAVEFKEEGLKFTPTVKERVIGFANGGNWHLEEVYADTASDPTGMSLLPLSSDFYNRYMADTIFHEYCHHIQGEVQNAKRIPAGSDHGGYYHNPDTEWGLIEGWAEFCALEAKRYNKIDSYAQYRLRGTLIDLELDYRMDDKFFRPEINKSSSMLEEMAIASLMVDLRDSTSDYGGIDDDSISLPTSTIWDAFHKKRDFGDGKGTRDVYTLHDFYVALKAETAGNTYLYEPYLRGENLTNLDYLFVRHGAYQDLNNNSKWDLGEPVGYAGEGTTLRSDLQAENGTEVSLNIVDQNGNAITKGAAIHVDVQFDGDNSYLSYSYDVPLSEGKVYVPVPPREYNATITMTAQQEGTGNKAANSFSLTTQEAYAALDPDKTLGTYTATLSMSSSISCTADYECGYLEAGDTCTSGVCGTGTTPGPEPSPECCSGAFILALALATAFASSKGANRKR